MTRVPAKAGRLAVDVQVVLRRLQNRLRANAATMFGGFGASQLTTLSVLEREGRATTSELAAALDIRPQSMAATIAALHEKGLISRTKDTADRRQIFVEITQPGRDVLEAIRKSDQDWLARAIADNLDGEQQATLAEAARILGHLLERTADDGSWPRVTRSAQR